MLHVITYIVYIYTQMIPCPKAMVIKTSLLYKPLLYHI